MEAPASHVSPAPGKYSGTNCVTIEEATSRPSRSAQLFRSRDKTPFDLNAREAPSGEHLNFFMMSREKAFSFIIYFLAKFLTWARAGKGYLNVLFGAQPRQANLDSVARSAIRTGSPIFRTNISDPLPIVEACRTS